LSRDSYDGTQADPLSQNHYLYAGGNPVIYVDPSGHMSMMSTSFGIATIAELYTIPNSVGFLFGRQKSPVSSVLLYYIGNMGMVITFAAQFDTGLDKLFALLDKLPYIKPSERYELKKSAMAIWGIGNAPIAPALTVMAQEVSFLILAKYGIMCNDINYIMGDY